jgi:uncharacterized protein YybS (DUF2232 family)
MTILNILGCTGSVTFILLAFIWIPFFGPILSLLTPLPFLYYSSKLGLNEGVKVCLAALLTVGIVAKLLEQPSLMLFCLQLGIAGLILGELFRREYSYSLTIFLGTLLILLVGSAFMFFESMTLETTPVESIIAYLQENWNAVIEMYEKGGLEPEQVDRLKKITPTIIDWFKKIIPSIVVIETGFIVWLNVVISKPLFSIKGIKYPDLGRADMWSAPDYLVWVLIAAGFSKLLSISVLDVAATNILIIIPVIYIFQGLSIVLFFFKKYNVPALTRFVIYLIIILQLLSLVILALMGLFDQWIDFRKIHSKARTTE